MFEGEDETSRPHIGRNTNHAVTQSQVRFLRLISKTAALDSTTSTMCMNLLQTSSDCCCQTLLNWA